LAKGLSQDALAADAGLFQKLISGIENGRANPELDTLGKIAKALGVQLRRPPGHRERCVYLIFPAPPPPPPILGAMPPGPPWVGCFVLPCLLVVPPPPPIRARSLAFALVFLFLAAASAEPERLNVVEGANALGSAAGATRNALARIATRRLRDIISSQAGMTTKILYHGCNAPPHSKPATADFKFGH
jgi:transcriptional regulator with XRE-family HTH domain